jgi:predicted Rossmann-fold nucleotide-binding protein
MSTSGHKLNRVAVFCGANAGTRPEYLQSANEVGQELVKRKIGLVYGGLLFNYAP